MYKNLKKITCTAIVMTTIFTSAGCNLVKNPKSKMTVQLLKPEERKFQTHVVKTGNVTYEHSSNGKVASKNTIKIHSSLSSGVMEEVYVNTWAKVKKGDMIAKYYTKDIEDRIEIQEIMVEECERELKMLRKDNSDQYRIEKAEFSLNIEKTKLKQLVKEKEEHVFRSPIDGVVSSVTTAKRGSVVGMNEVIATIMDANSIVVTVAPDEKELKKYCVGMKAEISYENKTYKAEVKEITLVGNTETRSQRGAILEFKDQIPKELGLESNVAYRVFGEEKKDVKLIPYTFLKVDEFGKTYVYIFKNEITEKRIIEIGISDGTSVEVKSGLEVNETIILK